MSIKVSIIGIDGCGKSTLANALPNLVAAELGLPAATASDELRCAAPDEDWLLPGFAPEGKGWAARLSQGLRRAAKAAQASKTFYPPFKLAHLAAQECATANLEAHYQPALIFSDSHLLLSALGRAINYMDLGSEPRAVAEALFGYLLEGRALPAEVAHALPRLSCVGQFRRLDRQLKLGWLDLPDVVIYLDITPAAALRRLRAKSARLDAHENEADLARARAAYGAVVAACRQRLGDDHVLRLEVTELSVSETLQAVVAFLRTLTIPPTVRAVNTRLGATAKELARTRGVLGKVLSPAYLFRYALPNLTHGSAIEFTFLFSPLGKLLFREGYSAAVMKAIYTQDRGGYGLLDKTFLAYPLHRAVYYRLQVLNAALVKELERRLGNLARGQTLNILTAPSGYAFDLLRPLARLAEKYPAQMRQVRLTASDLDPDGRIEAELTREAQRLGLRFEFIRGDLTAEQVREQLRARGPYEMVVFVGLSGWLPKPHLVRHFKLVHEALLRAEGIFVSDCFSAAPYALSGKYAGYKGHYYTPRDYAHLLAYCGFAPQNIQWQSGQNRLNHVCLAGA